MSARVVFEDEGDEGEDEAEVKVECVMKGSCDFLGLRLRKTNAFDWSPNQEG